MEDNIFKEFRELIEREAGIHLTEQKRSLLSNRIQKRLRALNISSEADYLKVVMANQDGDELVELIDVVSTNVTYFYREPQHFQILGDILKDLLAQDRKRIRLWCAAASSGEEPFTIAITAAEAMAGRLCDLKILGTDICTKVLKKAVNAVYEEKQLEKMPQAVRDRYLSAVQAEGIIRFQVKQQLRDMVTFKKLNLARFPYPLKGPLDVIMCRNVMIYFDTPLRQKIVNEFYRLLAPGGYMFLSHSENLLGIEHKFKPHAVAVFQKPL